VRLALDARVLGTDESLIIDGPSFRWAKKVPRDAWHLSGDIKEDDERCLDTVLRLAGKQLSLDPPERFVKAMSTLSGSLGGMDVPWSRVLPNWEHQAFIRRLVGELQGIMPSLPLDYFETVWCAGNAVLGSLQQAAVDRKAWQALVSTGAGNVPALQSFEPGPDSLASRVRYNRFKTLTGRLVVEGGPQVLTLKRSHRGMLRSVYGDKGTIVSLDFAALEARILLYEHGGRCEEADLYGMIAGVLGYDRAAIKGAVISELYGSSKWALGKHLGMEGVQLNDFIRNVKAYFKTSELLARVKAQFVATGKVINRYGRPVHIDEPLDNIFIAYYGQSTGVDVTMLGFKQVVERLKEKAPRTRPIFVLHDALLLDAHNDELGEVAGIKKVKVKGYVQSFPLKYERVT